MQKTVKAKLVQAAGIPKRQQAIIKQAEARGIPVSVAKDDREIMMLVKQGLLEKSQYGKLVPTEKGRTALGKLVQAAGLNEAVVKKVAKLTDRNDASGARVLVAGDILKNKKLAKAYEAMSTLRDYVGHMPAALGDFQYNELDRQLKAQLYKKLSADDADRVWGSL